MKVKNVPVIPGAAIRRDVADGVKGELHLIFRWPDAGFEPCALKVHCTLLELNLGTDIVHG